MRLKLLEAVDAVEAEESKRLLDRFNSAKSPSTKAEPGTQRDGTTRPLDPRLGRSGGQVDVHAWFGADSPLGRVFVAHHNQRVSALRIAKGGNFASNPDTGLSTSNWGVVDATGFVTFMRNEVGVEADTEPDPDQDRDLVGHVRAALAGGLTDIPLDLSSLASAPFHQEVLEATTQIPRGEVRTYKELAHMVGRPTSYRPVSEAMRRNPVPLLIPCHRVVHETFRRTEDVGKWGYGNIMKAHLLALEGAVS